MAEYIETSFSGRLHGVTYEDGKVIAVHIMDTDDVIKVFEPARHGRWERVIPSKSAAKWSTKVSCSNCHSAGYAHHKYCPNCGAKMDGGPD